MESTSVGRTAKKTGTAADNARAAAKRYYAKNRTTILQKAKAKRVAHKVRKEGIKVKDNKAKDTEKKFQNKLAKKQAKKTAPRRIH